MLKRITCFFYGKCPNNRVYESNCEASKYQKIKTTTATSTKRSNRRIRIPFRPRKTYIVKQDLSRPNNTITSNFQPKVPIITKIDSTTDDSYHYLVTIETTTDSSIEEIKPYKPESKNQKINDYQEYFF
mgnify:CR=1 FL=1